MFQCNFSSLCYPINLPDSSPSSPNRRVFFSVSLKSPVTTGTHRLVSRFPGPRTRDLKVPYQSDRHGSGQIPCRGLSITRNSEYSFVPSRRVLTCKPIQGNRVISGERRLSRRVLDMEVLF